MGRAEHPEAVAWRRAASPPGAQLEDLLIALAERRSFPETRFLVARGIVGETWSTQSAAGPESVLALPVKEPGEGWRDGGGVGTRSETEVPRRDAGAGWALNPSMLRHAGGCSHYRDYPGCRLDTSVDKTGGVDWKEVSEVSLFFV